MQNSPNQNFQNYKIIRILYFISFCKSFNSVNSDSDAHHPVIVSRFYQRRGDPRLAEAY